MNKKRLDFKSIHVKLLIYFTLFAILIITLIGGMEVFLFNNFYGRLKERDTVQLAETINRDYADIDDDPGVDLDAFIDYYARQNDASIIIMEENGYSLERVAGSTRSTAAYEVISEDINTSLWQIYSELKAGNPEGEDQFSLRRKSAKMITGEKGNGMSVLAYACYLTDGRNKETESGAESDVIRNSEGDYVMFIISPMHPTTSTIRILKNIMITIFAFAFAIVVIIALYLSQRISRPIKEITRSAAELGKGNFDTEFKGGHYSELNELADTLTVAAGEMKKTDMYQKDLIANVSHDIRTPLTMIKSYAEMIHDISGNDPEKRNEHLGIIIEEADRLNVLVNDMLNLSRLQSGKLELEKSPFDLSGSARDMLAGYDILIEQDGYVIKKYIRDGLIVNADEVKIRQVMNNIVNNAVKYCGEDKEIIVKLDKDGRDALFSVTDHGQGISEEELPHVWDKYYKSSTHHVRETSGTGLGLSIVKEILKLHDAEYGVSSEVGKGSTFWFRLPLEK